MNIKIPRSIFIHILLFYFLLLVLILTLPVKNEEYSELQSCLKNEQKRQNFVPIFWEGLLQSNLKGRLCQIFVVLSEHISFTFSNKNHLKKSKYTTVPDESYRLFTFRGPCLGYGWHLMAKSHNSFIMKNQKFTPLFNICWNWLIYKV